MLGGHIIPHIGEMVNEQRGLVRNFHESHERRHDAARGTCFSAEVHAHHCSLIGTELAPAEAVPKLATAMRPSDIAYITRIAEKIAPTVSLSMNLYRPSDAFRALVRILSRSAGLISVE